MNFLSHNYAKKNIMKMAKKTKVFGEKLVDGCT